MSKKLISVLLAAVLVLSMGTIAIVSVSANLADLPEKAEGTNRYFFYMPELMENEYSYTAGIYWWSGTGAHTAWPGQEAVAADATGVYYCDVPTDVPMIIWNNFVDGGTDPALPIYNAAHQTVNIGSEYYDPGESALYPEGNDGFDGMIYVCDLSKVSVSDHSGKMTFGGEWYYYYGNGEYGVTPDKADAPEVYTNRSFGEWDGSVPTLPPATGDTTGTETTPTQATTVTEPTQATTVTEPTQATTVTEPTQATTATTPADVAEYATITVDGKEYKVAVGETFSYTYNLTTPTKIENIQATTYFTDGVLALEAGTAREMFPVLRDITSVVYNTDLPGEAKYNATEGVEEGFDFTEGGILATFNFKVVAVGEATISTTVEEMVAFQGADLVTGGQVVADGVTGEEVVVAPEFVEPTKPTTEPTKPTTEPTTVTAPTTTEPKPTEPKPTEPKPTEPKPTEPKPTVTEPTESKPVVEPTTTEGTDATSATGTTPEGGNGAVGTGVTATIYVVLAVVLMAAAAVVVLRKRVNG